MRKQSTEQKMVNISVSVYKILTAAYPPQFQKEYGPHMLQLFRDCCIRSYEQKGPAGILSLWAVTLFDFVRSVITEHSQKETFMTRQLFTRLRGWALILGGIAFTLLAIAATIQEILPSYTYGRTLRAVEDGLDGLFPVVFLLGPPLIAIGMVGLAMRYGSQAGRQGKVVLYIGATCGVAALPLAYLAGELQPGFMNSGEEFILTYVVLLSTMFICLALFGIVSVRHKAMPRWNGLPIITGLWFPVGFLVSSVTTEGIWNAALMAATGLLFAGATILLGYSLQANPAREPIAAR